MRVFTIYFCRIICCGLTGALALMWLTTGLPAQEKANKGDMLAREAAEEFMKALKAEKIEWIMKVVEVPFFWDGVKNIKEIETLKTHLEDVLKERDRSKTEYKIKAVFTYGKIMGSLREKDRKLLDEFLEKTDRVVQVVLQRDGVIIFIRIRNGKAKVAGFRD